MVAELLEVLLLLGELLLELQQLLLLAELDGVVLVGLLALHKGVATVWHATLLATPFAVVGYVCVCVYVGWWYLLRTAETWGTGVTFGHDPERGGERSARGVGGEAIGGLDNGLAVHLDKNCGCGGDVMGI